MAKIVVFEDSYSIQEIIRLELSEHEITFADTLSGAFQILGQLACGEIEADFVLVDAHLRRENHDPVYHFDFPSLEISPAKNRLHQPLPIVNNHGEDAIRGSSYDQPGRDAKAIVDFIQRSGITAQTVGISADSMRHNGVDVDHDLTKNNLIGLARLVDSLVQSGADELVDDVRLLPAQLA